MSKNRLNWNTTSATSDKYLYITILRDLRSYCAKGYCDIEVTLLRFTDLPKTLVQREYNALPDDVKVKYLIIDWADLKSVLRAITTFMKCLHGINHALMNYPAYHEAEEEFTRYLIIKNEKK